MNQDVYRFHDGNLGYNVPDSNSSCNAEMSTIDVSIIIYRRCRLKATSLLRVLIWVTSLAPPRTLFGSGVITHTRQWVWPWLIWPRPYRPRRKKINLVESNATRATTNAYGLWHSWNIYLKCNAVTWLLTRPKQQRCHVRVKLDFNSAET